MKRRSVNRREFIESLGLGLIGSLALRKLALGSVAEAATVAPMRLITFTYGHPCRPEHFFPKTAPGPLTTESFNYNYAALKPLQKYASKLNVFKGITDSLLYDSNGPAGHFALSNFLTGTPYDTSSGQPIPVNPLPSLDRYLVKKITGTTSKAVNVYPGNGAPRSSWDPNGVAVGHYGSPVTLYNHLCNVLGVPYDYKGGANPAASAIQTRRDALGYVSKSLQRLMGKVGSFERQKLTAFVDGLSSIQAQVNASLTTANGKVPTRPDTSFYRGVCDFPPTTPQCDLQWPFWVNPQTGLIEIDHGYNEIRDGISRDLPLYNKSWNLMQDLLIQGIQLDAFHNITIDLDVSAYSASFPMSHQELNDQGQVLKTVDSCTSVHDDLAHIVSNATSEESHQLATHVRNMMAYLAKFMDRMAAVTDVDGRTLLDNALVISCSDLGLAEGAGHGVSNLPLITWGDGGGYFKTGNYVDLVPSQPPIGTSDVKAQTSHTKILTSIARAFGIHAGDAELAGTTSWGSAKYAGEIAAIKK